MESPGRYSTQRKSPYSSSPGSRSNSGLSRRACRPNRSPLLKAFAAIDRPPLSGLERNRGFLATLGTNRPCFDALGISRTYVSSLHAVALARFAALGFVLESLIYKEHLLAGGEDKFRTAFGAFQNFVMVFHTLLRDRVRRGQEAVESASTGKRNAATLCGIHSPVDTKLLRKRHVNGSPNPAHAAAFSGGVCARGLLWRDAAPRASYSSCAS